MVVFAPTFRNSVWLHTPEHAPQAGVKQVEEKAFDCLLSINSALFNRFWIGNFNDTKFFF